MLNHFHPVYHSYTYLAGSRVDMERVLEPSLDCMDPEELVDEFSEPPQFFERLSPVSTTIGDTPVKGRNWTDMMIKCYRMFGKIFTRSAAVLEQVLEDQEGESTMVPFLSITVDPDALVRLIDRDYEAGETSYLKLLDLFEDGVISPSFTVPFHPILPLLRSPFDQRLCVKMGLHFFRPVLKCYEKYLKRIGENQMTLAFWAPESCMNHETLRIVSEEFMAFCKAEKFQKPHLIFLMDADWARDVPLDPLMKHWHRPDVPGLEDAPVSVVFRDLPFSEWMMSSHPSIKKIIDRTIAKVDGRLDEKGVDYSWAHFERLENLTFSPRDAVHLEQRILKLCELGYLAISPDTFIRRKVNGTFAADEGEPLGVLLRDADPESEKIEENNCFERWRGWVHEKGEKKVGANRPYERKSGRSNVKCAGSPCWKVAWTLTRDACFDAVGGNPDKLTGGALGLLAKCSGQKTKDGQRKNVEAFLVEYAKIYWREHFVQHGLSEGDIRLDEIIRATLRKGSRKALTPPEMGAAACAAQAYYFLLDSNSSYAMEASNMDQRALFQNAVMLTLAFCHQIAAFHYLNQKAKARELAEMLQKELADFETAYERYDLKSFGITVKAWKETIASEIPDSKLNVVARAARRTAARHLLDFGYGDIFAEEDEEISTNVGHNWTGEVNGPNYNWANPAFCGVKEA